MIGVIITAIICATLVSLVYIGCKYGKDCSNCKHYEEKDK